MKSDIKFITQSIEAESKLWVLVVALRDGEIVGACEIIGWAETHVTLSSLSVQPEWRGQGIGSELINACVEHARQAGKTAINLTVAKSNPRAEALYRRLGFLSVLCDEKNFWMAKPLGN